LRKLFDKSLHGLELHIDGGSAIVDAFYAIWTHKFMHARINEFFSSRGDRIATAKGQHSKGGHGCVTHCLLCQGVALLKVCQSMALLTVKRGPMNGINRFHL
jgi:hypothetical protein